MQDLSVREFLEKLSSKEPVPGGGGAAAMAGALAAALSSMVANLTVGNEKFKENEQTVEMVKEEAGAMEEELLQSVAEDADTFKAFMECLKMPKGTDEEKAKRTEAVSAAAKAASLAPFKIMRSSLDVMKIAQRLVKIGNPNVVTDAACSAILARAAARSAAYNVDINLKYVRDDDFNARVKKETEDMVHYAEALEEEILHAVNAKLDA